MQKRVKIVNTWDSLQEFPLCESVRVRPRQEKMRQPVVSFLASLIYQSNRKKIEHVNKHYILLLVDVCECECVFVFVCPLSIDTMEKGREKKQIRTAWK